MLREPRIIDTNAEYIFVTDKPAESKVWHVVVDPELAQTDPLYAAYYVRYHAHQYASTHIVFVVDASVQFNDSLDIIANEFISSSKDYLLMLNNFPDDEAKMLQWKDGRKALSQSDYDSLARFIDTMGQSHWKGSIGQTFFGFRYTNAVKRFLDECWKYVLELGNDGKPNRLDEVIVNKLLYLYKDNLKLYITAEQIVQSTYMTYCFHRVAKPVPKYHDYDQYYYLCNRPVYPHRFDKCIRFPVSYRYRTEAMLLTKYLNADDLREWLDHHLDICKFDRIHVFDNESNYDVRAICAEYGDRVTYELIEGQAYQYRLYDSYIECRSNAEWIIPLDDDEYLDIGDFPSIYDGVMYYRDKFPHMDMLAIRWKHMFPKRFKEERTGKVLDYCTEENPELARKFMWLGDGTVKTIVRRYGRIHYEETWENPCGGHVPKNSVFLGALLPDGRNVQGVGIPDCPDTLEDERMRILHCRYKGPKDYADKMSTAMTVSDSVQRKKKWKFDEILPTLD